MPSRRQRNASSAPSRPSVMKAVGSGQKPEGEEALHHRPSACRAEPSSGEARQCDAAKARRPGLRLDGGALPRVEAAGRKDSGLRRPAVTRRGRISCRRGADGRGNAAAGCASSRCRRRSSTRGSPAPPARPGDTARHSAGCRWWRGSGGRTGRPGTAASAGMCSLSYHSLNSASAAGLDIHRVDQEPAGIVGRQLVARQDLIALEAHQALDLAGHPLRPGRQVVAADRLVGRALQHADRVEIVGRDRDLAVLRRRSSAGTGGSPGTRSRSGRCSVSYQSWNSSSAALAIFIAAIRMPLAIASSSCCRTDPHAPP